MKYLHAVLGMIGVAAVVMTAALLTGTQNAFWPGALGFALGLTYALAVVNPQHTAVWTAAMTIPVVVGLRYYATQQNGLAGLITGLAISAVLFLAHRRTQRPAHGS